MKKVLALFLALGALFFAGCGEDKSSQNDAKSGYIDTI